MIHGGFIQMFHQSFINSSHQLLTQIKRGFQKYIYCKTTYLRSRIIQMWILKNSEELLGHHKSSNLNLTTNIKSIDCSTLYVTIPHQKLKSWIATSLPYRTPSIKKKGKS